MVIDRTNLPKEIEELAGLEFGLPYREEDSPESCPVSLEDLIDYLRMESADLDGVSRQQLTFARTVFVNGHKYWVWRFFESDGEECYASVALTPDGVESLSYASNFASLNPEQWVVAGLFEYM